MEITEVFSDIKDSIGDKWFFILLGGCALLFIWNLNKNSSTSNNSAEMVTVSSVSSYPDAVTNANVIIDSLQNSIEYSEKQIIDEIDNLELGIGDKFEATNNYIQTGIEETIKVSDKISGLGDDISSLNSNINNKYNSLSSKLDKNTNISATTYYELMLLQGREGHIAYDPDRAMAVLKNMGFNTSNEKATLVNNKLANIKASKEGIGWTTFTGTNAK